ncbi:TPA: DUF1673 domain-containing protein [Methanosarcina acetivorans]|uniref:DUF1673 domain-containing protein n=2 Tax=Methanosarcina acetivorans TaxID=2214 RepID=Q8THM2_METAC|nr:DUF1673 domain-containing protein [Methanosarcina acetivorans]AAM07832.1 predicted protein [Methanosarcina acetivorans C2A]HIH94205.1 DUF1673 domain-containing protein [Methanosarcina acetivorans]
MNLNTEYIKKLIGWCPNVRASEARRNVSFENFNSDIHERAGKENRDPKNLGWFRKASTRPLLIYTFFTLIYLMVFHQIGISPIFLLAGSFSSLFLSIFFWKKQMQKYDELIKKPVTECSNKRKMSLFATIFAVYFVMSYIMSYLDANAGELAVQAMISFIGGFLVSMWLEYLQILYWERKNRKVIYIDKGYGWKKSYIILERE